MAVAPSVFVEIALQMLLGNGMIDATNTAFYERPETVDGLRVDIPAHIHLLCMADAAMVISVFPERVINRVFVCEDRGLRQHILFDVRHHRSTLNVWDRKSNEIGR